MAKLSPELFGQVVSCLEALTTLYSDHETIETFDSCHFVKEILNNQYHLSLSVTQKRAMIALYVLKLQEGNSDNPSEHTMLFDELNETKPCEQQTELRHGAVVYDSDELGSNESSSGHQPELCRLVRGRRRRMVMESVSTNLDVSESIIQPTRYDPESEMVNLTGGERFEETIHELEQRATYDEQDPTHSPEYIEYEQMVQGNLRWLISCYKLSRRSKTRDILSVLQNKTNDKLVKETVEGIMFLRWKCGGDPQSPFHFNNLELAKDENIDAQQLTSNCSIPRVPMMRY